MSDISLFMEPGAQKSVEWLMARVGKITASRFCDVMAKLKNGSPAAAHKNYMWEVAIERITGRPTPHYTSAAMQWGIQYEPISRMAYEAATGAMVEEVGFIHHPTRLDVGGSPDGLVGEDGIWESKSPIVTAIHLACFMDGVPEEHTPQMQGLCWITGREWCDFQSYDPRLPKPFDRFTKRVYRDDIYIANLAKEVAAFSDGVTAIICKLEERAGLRPTKEQIMEVKTLMEVKNDGA